MELAVEELVVDVDIEVAVLDDIEDGLVLITLLLLVMELLAGAPMTIELDAKTLVYKTVVSTSRART